MLISETARHFLVFPNSHRVPLPTKRYPRTSTTVGNFTFQPNLSLSNTMSITKTLVTGRAGESSSPSKKRITSSPSSVLSPAEPSSSSAESMEPAKKLVRWSTDILAAPSTPPPMPTTESASEAASSSLIFKKRVDKMRRREESKRSSRSLEDLSATELQEVMQRMEHKIHKIARKELAFLNQSKKLREARTIMTSRHQRLAQTLQQALRAKDPSATVDAPRLPPVLSTGSSGNPALIDLTE
jgi:hypothetical protein